MLALIKRAWKLYQFYGPRVFLNRLKAKTKNRIFPPFENYNTTTTKKDNVETLFSVIVPLHNPDYSDLMSTIESVFDQSYQGFELCFSIDSPSIEPRVEARLNELAQNDPRVKFKISSSKSSISLNSNNAVESSTHQWLIFLDQGDLLLKDCLSELTKEITTPGARDIIYSDEIKIDEDGKVIEETRKPDWSPFYFRSFMYLGHIVAIKRELFKKLGGFRKEYDGSQDYDLLLRALDLGANVSHISKPLYAWRAHTGSVANSRYEKPWAFEAGLKAVRASLPDNLELRMHPYPGVHRIYASQRNGGKILCWATGSKGIYLDAKENDGININQETLIDIEETLRTLSVISSQDILLLNAKFKPRLKHMVDLLQRSLWHQSLAGVQGVLLDKDLLIRSAGYDNNFKPNFYGQSFISPAERMELVAGCDLKAVSLEVACIRKSILQEVLNNLADPLSFYELEKNFAKHVLSTSGSLFLQPEIQFSTSTESIQHIGAK